MGILIIIISAALLAALVLVFKFGLWGAVAASLMTGLIAGWVGQELRGFGNPTGTMPSNLNWSLFFEHFLFWTFIGFIVFPLIVFVKILVNSQTLPTTFLAVWLVILGTAAVYHLGKLVYKESNRIDLHFHVGFDEELELERSQVDAVLINRSDEESITFNSGGSSLKPNKFGYRKSFSGNTTIFFKPDSLMFSIWDCGPYQFDIAELEGDIRIYVNFEKVIKLFVDGELKNTISIDCDYPSVTAKKL